MQTKYIFWGLLSCSFITGMEYPLNTQYVEEKIKALKKRKREDLLWQAEYIDSDGQLVTTLKLPLYIYHNRKDICKKENQLQFLEKFKDVELPYILSSAEKKIFKTLKCNSLVVIKKVDTGWELSASPSICKKRIDVNSLWKK